LTDGDALVVFQDYKYWGAWWVAAIAEFFAGRLAIEHVLDNNTVSFRVKAPLTADVVETLPTWERIGGEECAALQDAAAERLENRGDATGAAIVRLGKARMWMHKNEPERALACCQASERSWPFLAEDANLSAARAWLEHERGEALPPLPRTRLRRLLLPVARRLRRTGLS
jgi:hypothetical protein